MSAKLVHLPSHESIDAITAVLQEDGGVIVEGFLERGLVEAIQREVEAPLAAADPGMKHLNPAIQWFFGDKTRHVSGMAGKSRSFATEVLTHPVYMGVCDRVLLPSCARYQLNIGHLIARGPGSTAQMLHRDELVWVGGKSRCSTQIEMSGFSKVEMSAFSSGPRYPRGHGDSDHELRGAGSGAGDREAADAA